MPRYKLKYYELKSGGSYWSLMTDPWDGPGVLVCRSKLYAVMGQARKSARAVFTNHPFIHETKRVVKVLY